MTRFVSMPSEMIPALKELLMDVSPEDGIDHIMYDLGFRWGSTMVRICEESCSRDGLKEKVSMTAVHTGITNMDVKVMEDRIEITPYDKAIDDMDFLAGYVSGTISELLGAEHVGTVKGDVIHVVKANI